MKTYYFYDKAAVSGVGSPSEEYILSKIPRPFTLFRDHSKLCWVLTCPEKPRNHLVYGIIWRES